MKAKELKKLAGLFAGDARLYELDPPLNGNKYVVVSAATAPISGPETYIFAATERGSVTSWAELEGSYRGELDHEEALRRAGYKVTEKH